MLHNILNIFNAEQKYYNFSKLNTFYAAAPKLQITYTLKKLNKTIFRDSVCCKTFNTLRQTVSTFLKTGK